MIAKINKIITRDSFQIMILIKISKILKRKSSVKIHKVQINKNKTNKNKNIKSIRNLNLNIKNINKNHKRSRKNKNKRNLNTKKIIKNQINLNLKIQMIKFPKCYQINNQANKFLHKQKRNLKDQKAMVKNIVDPKRRQE